jgi:hypothetical protein
VATAMSFASRASLIACLIALVPATAFAGPTVGVSFGKAETQGDANDGDDANTTLGLYVRGRIASMLSLQGELSKLQTDDTSSSSIRTWNLAAVVDLAHGRFVPILLVGGGMDVISQSYQTSDTTYAHAEIGGGLEYRMRGGFVLGADLRIGTRTLESQPVYADPIAAGAPSNINHPTPSYVASSSLSEGQYRSMRLTLGVHF